MSKRCNKELDSTCTQLLNLHMIHTFSEQRRELREFIFECRLRLLMVERKTSDSGVADSNPVGGEILKRFLRLYTVCVFLTEVGITEKVNLLLVEVQNN